MTKPPAKKSAKAKATAVEDKDVRRLEDRIEASSQAAQLRLEAVMARIDGKFETITSAIVDIKSSQAESKESMRTWGTWIIATVLAVGLGMAGVVVGVKQIWIGGVQVGQTLSSPTASKP